MWSLTSCVGWVASPGGRVRAAGDDRLGSDRGPDRAQARPASAEHRAHRLGPDVLVVFLQDAVNPLPAGSVYETALNENDVSRGRAIHDDVLSRPRKSVTEGCCDATALCAQVRELNLTVRCCKGRPTAARDAGQALDLSMQGIALSVKIRTSCQSS
jgi:hypothetical protein